MRRISRIFVSDFETTVYEGQTATEVWASASVELFSDEPPKIFHSIEEQFNYFVELDCNLIVYYHNLKFDGSFWLNYLIRDLKLKQAFEINPTTNAVTWVEEKNMKNNTFKYTISDMGQWYSIIIKINNNYIEFRDSLKLLPFSLKRIGQAFKTKHQKLEMEYTGYRYAGCTITPEEQEYIANDVYVIKEALEIMYEQGHKALTIGACCLSEYKKIISKEDYSTFFPSLYSIELDYDTYGSTNADEYIRKSYKGGWCYVVKGKEKQLKYNGTTADVNSLYPSMMSSESGNRYPVGKPIFWKGNYLDEHCSHENIYYFVRIKTRFKIKPNMLPFVQIKNSINYRPNQALETSDVYDIKNNRYIRSYYDRDGTLVECVPELTLTKTDFELFMEHYNIEDFEILDGCWFFTMSGLFDEYINKYKKIKQTSKGALRELAKLFLNNLYGKMASSTVSTFKVATLGDDGGLSFYVQPEYNKKEGFIAVGSAITSYARNFTIRAAQMNYYGKDKRGFIYADTDSIHCDLKPEELKGIKVHESDFCCWKLESCWDIGWFVRQKTYIEHVVQENLEDCTPYYNVKCAGMPEHCKQLFIKSLEGCTEEELKNYTQEEQEFIKTKRTITDFKEGLCVTGKLMPKQIKGGILLTPTTFKIKG